tara:strand:+ start:1330 stop:2601 length:1272 start_codon:yes stop_codon:yes gene_type:complete
MIIFQDFAIIPGLFHKTLQKSMVKSIIKECVILVDTNTPLEFSHAVYVYPSYIVSFIVIFYEKSDYFNNLHLKMKRSYQDVINSTSFQTVTEKEYQDVPLANNYNRAKIIENMVKNHYSSFSGFRADDPKITYNSRGKNGISSSPYDFFSNNERIEVKSSQMTWKGLSWYVNWRDIKTENFDKLLLALYYIDGIYVYEYNKNIHLSRYGKSSQGYAIVFKSGRSQSFTDAYNTIHEKLKEFFLFKIPCSEYEYGYDETITQKSLHTTSISKYMPKKRGVVVEKLVRCFLENNGIYTSDALLSKTVNGISGKNNTEYDFGIENLRVEVKSTQLMWDKHSKRWCLRWQNVKKDKHDLLLLVACTNHGLYIYKHEGKFGVTTNGKSLTGKFIRVMGKVNDICTDSSFGVIHSKLKHMYIGNICLTD